MHEAMSSQGGQLRAEALARSFLAHSVRSTFISALSPRIRGATPLYFFVIALAVNYKRSDDNSNYQENWIVRHGETVMIGERHGHRP